MKKFRPVTALLTAAMIIVTAEWFLNREKSLISKLLDSLGG